MQKKRGLRTQNYLWRYMDGKIIFQIMHMFCNSFTYEQLRKETASEDSEDILSTATIADWYSYLLQTSYNNLWNWTWQIVQIDNSKIGKNWKLWMRKNVQQYVGKSGQSFIQNKCAFDVFNWAWRWSMCTHKISIHPSKAQVITFRDHISGQGIEPQNRML